VCGLLSRLPLKLRRGQPTRVETRTRSSVSARPRHYICPPRRALPKLKDRLFALRGAALDPKRQVGRPENVELLQHPRGLFGSPVSRHAEGHGRTDSSDPHLVVGAAANREAPVQPGRRFGPCLLALDIDDAAGSPRGCFCCCRRSTRSDRDCGGAGLPYSAGKALRSRAPMGRSRGTLGGHSTCRGQNRRNHAPARSTVPGVQTPPAAIRSNNGELVPRVTQRPTVASLTPRASANVVANSRMSDCVICIPPVRGGDRNAGSPSRV